MLYAHFEIVPKMAMTTLSSLTSRVGILKAFDAKKEAMLRDQNVRSTGRKTYKQGKGWKRENPGKSDLPNLQLHSTFSMALNDNLC
jgi:hypothetical protein